MITLSRFWTLKLPVITNNLKHLFIENQLSVVYLRTMKVIWIKHKKSLIDTLLFRCFSICSDYTLFNLEVEHFRKIFKNNSYPSGIIEQSIRSFLNKLHVLKKVIPTVPKKELFIILPYLGTLSSTLKIEIRTCFKNSLPQCNIKIILQSANRLSSLFLLKDVIPKEVQFRSVYKFSCVNCSVTYFGKTERHRYITLNTKKGTIQTICSFSSPFTA